MKTIQDIKDEFQKAIEKAQACTTPKEAEDLYNHAPSGSVADVVYKARWEELAKLEAEVKAQACTTSEEAEKLYNRAPIGSVAEKLYRARWVELEDAESKK